MTFYICHMKFHILHLTFDMTEGTGSTSTDTYMLNEHCSLCIAQYFTDGFCGYLSNMKKWGNSLDLCGLTDASASKHVKIIMEQRRMGEIWTNYTIPN